MTPAAGTLWASGGTLRIAPGSASSVPAKTSQVAWDNYVKGYCLGGIVGSTDPAVTAWYSLSGSWPGSERMGGCVSDKTNGQLIFFGAGSFGHIQGRNGNHKIVAEPRPGAATEVLSPKPIPADATKVDVTISSSAGNLKGTTVVAAGEQTLAEAIGDFVVSCWLLIDPEPGEKPNAHNALAECLALVKYLILGAAPPTSKKGFVTRQAAAAAAPAAGCQARRVAYVVHTKEKRVVSARSTVSRLGPRSVRYSCTMSGGTMKIRLDGRVKGGLRKALGTRLHLRLVRNATAPRRGAKLKFGFSW